MIKQFASSGLGARLAVATAVGAAEFSGAGEANPAVFKNEFEGSFYAFYSGYYGVPFEDVPVFVRANTQLWEEAQLTTITARSYLSSNFFIEVPY